MQEKASYEAASSTLEALLNECNEEKQELADAVSRQKSAFSVLEPLRASEVEESSEPPEDADLRRIEFLENALKDCGDSKDELLQSIRVLEEEKEKSTKLW